MTGENTYWLSVIEPGDLFTDGASGLMVRIASVDSETQLTLAYPWPGTEIVDGAYEVQLMPRSVGVQERTRQLLAKVSNGTEFKYDESGPLADRSYYDLRRKNFGFLDTSENPPELYVKASDLAGDWAGPFMYGTGPAPDLEFSPVVTGAAGSQAGVAVSGSDPYELTFTIPRGDKGERGYKGWSIEPELVVDGSRRVLRVAGFIGGEGSEPDGEGLYVGVGGLVSSVANAIDVRGAVGPQGVRGLTWRRQWSSTLAYVVDDLVSDNDDDANPATWIATAASTGSRPRDNPSAWDRFPAGDTANATLGYKAEIHLVDYAIGVDDNGKCLIAAKSTPITFTLGAAATLGVSFVLLVRNDGPGALTVSPVGGQTIDGATALLLPAGASAIIKGDGNAFHSIAGNAALADKLDKSGGVMTGAIENAIFAAPGDNTKRAHFDLAAVGAGQDRAIMVPNAPNLALSKWELVRDDTLSAVSSYDVTGLSAFRRLRISGHIYPSIDSGVALRTSSNNGVSYDSGATDYGYQFGGGVQSTATAVAGNTSAIPLTLNLNSDNTNDTGLTIDLFMENFNKAVNLKALILMAYTRDDATLVAGTLLGRRNQATARDAFRLYSGLGTLSGVITVEGWRG